MRASMSLDRCLVWLVTMTAAMPVQSTVPKLSLLRVAQEPTTRCVTVDYTLDAPAIVTFDVLTNGVSIGAANVTHAYGDVNRLVQGGVRAISWQAAKSWPGHMFSDDTVSVEVTAWSPDSPPDYMVRGSMPRAIRHSHKLQAELNQKTSLNRRQAVAVDLAVNIKGIDISHTAYVVQYCKYAGVDVLGIYIVLA